MGKRKITRQPFLGPAFCAAAGVWAADGLGLGWGEIWPGCVLALGLVFLAGRERRRVAGLAVCVLVGLSFVVLHGERLRLAPEVRLAAARGDGPVVVDVSGTVADEPIVTGGGSLFPLRLDGTDGAKALVLGRGTAPGYGERLRVRGSWRRIAEARNPGELDVREVYFRRGIRNEIEVGREADMERLEGWEGNWLKALALRARRWMEGALGRGLEREEDAEARAVILGMTLGSRERGAEEVLDLFQRTGTLHLFSVSGLHVAFFAGVCLVALRACGLGRRWAAGVAAPLLFFYALVTGWSPAAVRAAVMGAVLLGGVVAGRRALSVNSVCAAGLFLLLVDSHQLFGVGFQFSFGVVLTLAALAPVFQKLLRRWTEPDEFIPKEILSRSERMRWGAARSFAGLFSVSLAAWVGSLPLGIGYFHLVSPVALPANLLAVPLSSAVVALGLGSLAVAVVSARLSGMMNWANGLLVHGLIAALRLFDAAPGGSFHVGGMEGGLSGLGGRVTIFDLRNGGGATLLEPGPGLVSAGAWLVDTGGANDWRRSVRPGLRLRGVNGLAGLVASHGDEAHIGGLLAAAEELGPKRTLEPGLDRRSATLRTAREGGGMERLRRGDTLDMGRGWRLRVLFPPEGWLADRADDRCLVLRLDTPGGRLLLAGDSGLRTELWLLAHAKPDELRADVLVAGSNRGDFFLSPDFVARTGARVVVTGRPGPHERGTSMLEQAGGMAGGRRFLYWPQELTGGVVVEVRPDGLRLGRTLGGRPWLPLGTVQRE